MMKNIAFKSVHIVAFVIAGFAISRSASADTRSHLTEMAAKIDSQATRLLRETIHYRHTPNYSRMVAEVAMLRAKARHMRFTTFNTHNFHHLEEDLRIVDRCFHKVEAFFDSAEISALHGHGHIHGNTRHVKNLLNCMEDTIHHMQDDVRALRRTCFGHRGRGRIESSIYSPNVIYGGSRTIYDNGITQIRLDPFDDCPNDRIYRGGRRDFRHDINRSGLQINRGNLSFRIKF